VSTLAGNFIALSSMANLIVVQKAAARDYFEVGAPLTFVILAIGTLWLCL
jgi:Na+/H+ antiporter NhaD/arsenite permease-like protein